MNTIVCVWIKIHIFIVIYVKCSSSSSHVQRREKNAQTIEEILHSLNVNLSDNLNIMFYAVAS